MTYTVSNCHQELYVSMIQKKRVFCFKTPIKPHYLRGVFVQLFIAIPHRSDYDSNMATLGFSKF